MATGALPRYRVLLVGNGPSNDEKAAAHWRREENWTRIHSVVCVRAVPEWVKDIWWKNPGIPIEVVNCDVNSNEDAPPPLGRYDNVFLYHVTDMKNAACQRGWSRFAYVHPPNGAFFSGIQAIRYVVESFNCEEVHCVGIDFDDQYIKAAWESTWKIPSGRFSSAAGRAGSWEQLRDGVRSAFQDIKKVLQEHNTCLYTSSPYLMDHLRESIPARFVKTDDLAE